MMINFERLISRGASIWLSKKMDLAGWKRSVNSVVGIVVVFGIIALVATSVFTFLVMKFSLLLSILAGIAAWVAIPFVIYVLLEYRIDGRKTLVETYLPDYFQIASANLRSGIALDRALLLAARPDFTVFSNDVKDMARSVFAGETLENGLTELGRKYNSYQLSHSIRMMIEALRYGGAMADLLEQISKDLRAQNLAQKEIAGQMLMYSIFIAFAGLIAAPVLYGLTSQMILITDTVWKGILAANPNGLPTAGISFLKPSPPKITPAMYHEFAVLAIIVICGAAAIIMASISKGSAVKGIVLLVPFIVMGLIIFTVVSYVIGLMFGSLGSL
ncbi:MAG: type II secretion system F family protein [Candidatus Micrarchaeaceae archaeon]